MYLKEIKAHGFKSFADKINIELSSGTNAIVGPNGSGKSNIVDAVRWVLGEQSVKSLRGNDSMTDVIFSGSKSRKESGSASVTIIFDNTDKYLPLDYTEVAIKRKVYKDGTNEYYLNNQKCRLKDIVDILLDSGIAKESFNIISQGKIEEILNSKPSDRRVIFEEAAGVLKYKRRKEAALKKIEKTQDNITRAEDIIKELENQVEPLKEQKDKALKYEKLTKELENIEVSLITNDIKKINITYLDNKRKQEKLNTELMVLTTNNSSSEAKIEEYKNKTNKLELSIDALQESLIKANSDLEKANSEKQIILERKKYQVDDIKLHNSLVELKEQELNLNNQISNIKEIIENKNKAIELLNRKQEELNKELRTIKNNKDKENISLSNLIKNNSNLNIKIDNLQNEIENNLDLPSSVRAILNNFRLEGIHNTLGKIIEIEEKYALAISSSLGSSTNNVIVDNEESAKKAITFLKEKNSGRVTFYPLSVMKPKNVDIETINILNKQKGYINIASNLVKYDKKYNSVVLNQLGNVIIVNNIDDGNTISKAINYRYKVVTLEGEIFNVGGSITGGKTVYRNVINIKFELESLIKNRNDLTREIKEEENKINEIDYELKNKEDELYLNNKELINEKEFIESRNNSLNTLTTKLDEISLSIRSTDGMLNNSLSKEEENIINKYYEIEKEKNTISLKLKELISEKESIKEEQENYEHTIKQENTIYNSKQKEANNLEIEINRAEVKLDMLLNTLNENYNLTYEKAKEDYILVDDEDESRNKESNLKREIKELGIVNLGAIEEYDRVSKRYEFLISQKEDLLNAMNTLSNIINEMDEVMIKEFSKSFKIIKEKFNETFRELFKGGSADLKLTDPSNLLETGVEIIASPPGKKLTSISLLSGGEKTFTAISLLFAILKSRRVPFCILDEVEAALDEVNVSSFGEYINKLKDKTQFVLITHKKKTMEYVDVLYGITMQESGVSKLVSVKLEDMRRE
ncbi:MAG: AAA family ATPase [Bacilli bacterium]|nr:AAA family ATPase [Bacilli bacterium]